MKRLAAPALLSSLALAFTLSASPAVAENQNPWISSQSRADASLRTNRGAMPPAGYLGQHWTHPVGCEYSRAGRPGETVWYVIVNTRRAGCPTYIVQRGHSDIYQ